MASEWREVELGEVAEIVGGATPDTRKPEYFGGDIPWITPKDLSGYGFRKISRGERMLTIQGLESCGAKLMPEGTVLLTSRAPIGYVAISQNPVCTNQGFKSLILKPKQDPLFYYYLLKHNTETLERHATGSTFKEISTSVVRSIKFRVPEYSEQKRIAGILGALDDKIELNRKMNETLEQMAKTLFKSWFVDFDPVHAKAAGRQPAGIDKATADLFPDSFVDSELGKIPTGWRVKTADELSHVGIGKTPPRKEHQWFSEDPTDLPWMSIRDLGNSGVYISQTSEFLTRDAVERFRVKRIPDNTVVLSFKLTMGRVAITSGEMLSNEAIAHFSLKPQATIGSLWLYCYLKGFNYDQLGSTSSIATAINSDSVRGIQILVPEKDATKEFERRIEPAFAQIRNLQEQSRTLSKMRDSLLPKLLAGA
jgi:type I restriction enzyme S subunit